MTYSASIQIVDQAFGGREEGGWWYSYGMPTKEHQSLTREFKTEKEAYEYAHKHKTIVDELNEGRPSINSVLSRGVYQWIIQHGKPRVWPKTKPRYS